MEELDMKDSDAKGTYDGSPCPSTLPPLQPPRDSPAFQFDLVYAQYFTEDDDDLLSMMDSASR